MIDVDCMWKEWGNWGLCSVTCGQGEATRFRSHKVEVQLNGIACTGPNEELEVCTADCVKPTPPPEVQGALSGANIDVRAATYNVHCC